MSVRFLFLCLSVLWSSVVVCVVMGVVLVLILVMVGVFVFVLMVLVVMVIVIDWVILSVGFVNGNIVVFGVDIMVVGG